MSQQLEDRFYSFAKNTRDFCSEFKPDIINNQYITQLIRSSSSIGANYIEASDSLGNNDERMKLKIARREAKESIYWLQLLVINNRDLEEKRLSLINEVDQIRKILSAIILKLG